MSLDNSFTYLDEGSMFHFRDNIVENEIVPWLRAATSRFLSVLAAGWPCRSGADSGSSHS
jgi:hypothetical protein